MLYISFCSDSIYITSNYVAKAPSLCKSTICYVDGVRVKLGRRVKLGALLWCIILSFFGGIGALLWCIILSFFGGRSLAWHPFVKSFLLLFHVGDLCVNFFFINRNDSFMPL